MPNERFGASGAWLVRHFVSNIAIWFSWKPYPLPRLRQAAERCTQAGDNVGEQRTGKLIIKCKF
jgi:hypothetical protein